MEVILAQDVKGLGEKGQLVKVADGYGRNYLLPRGLAVPATAGNRRQAEELKAVQARRQSREEKEAERLAAQLADLTLTMRAKAGEGGKLFGSITAADIAEALAEQQITVDKRKIVLAEPIKAVGEYALPIRLLPSRTTQVRVKVEAS